MTTTKEMIAIMQAFEDGMLIEVTNAGRCEWRAAPDPKWNWINFDYRVATTKPSVDWNHVSREFNFLVRHSPSHGGVGVVLSRRPTKGRRVWIPSDGRECDVECLSSYNPGTCDWQDSLVVRPGYEEDTNNGQ